MELLIKMTWDPDASVWVAESDDVPGLVMESGSFDALIEKLRFAVPELLQLNGTLRSPLRLNFVSSRHEQVSRTVFVKNGSIALAIQVGFWYNKSKTKMRQLSGCYQHPQSLHR